MEILKAIKERRSIRNFQKKDIPAELLTNSSIPCLGA